MNEVKDSKQIMSSSTDGAVKGYINKYIDVLIPREVIDKNIETLLNEYSVDSLKLLLMINSLVKSYLIYIVSDIESLIDTWAYKVSRTNKFITMKLKEISDDDFIKYLFNSRKKLNDYKYAESNILNQNKTILSQITNSTLGKKIYIINFIKHDLIKELFKTKRSKTHESDVEKYFNNLQTSRKIRNYITHESFVLAPEFWKEIYIKTIGERETISKDVSLNTIVKKLFKELENTLRIADYGQLQNRFTNLVIKQLKDNGFKKSDLTKLNIEYLFSQK